MAKVIFEDVSKVYPDECPQAAGRDGGKVRGRDAARILRSRRGRRARAGLERPRGHIEVPSAEKLVHFATGSHPIVTDDVRDAIDGETAFEDVKRQAASAGQFTARFAPGPPEVGEPINLGFRTEQLHLFDPETGQTLR